MNLKKIFMLVMTVIFFISASAVSAEKVSTWQPERKIGILVGVSQVTLEMSAPCVMIDAETKKQIRKIDANKKFLLDTAKLKNNSVEIRGEKVQLKDLQVTINDKKYFGGVQINKNSNSITVINLAPIEEYLRGVVPEEMSPSFELEALKAQAIAARSFVLANSDKHKSQGFDICATTHCQSYKGVEVAKSQTDLAIQKTRGEVIQYGGKTVTTNFHTDSGGMTATCLEVWGTDTPYLQSVEEIQKQTEAWTKKFSKADVASRFGENFGDLKKIELSNLVIGKAASDRTISGRIKFANFVGKKTVKLTGNEIRAKFSLPSTLCDIKISGDEVIFSGFGRGHGVGMSQQGANNFAKAGWTYDKILTHYYKGTEIKKLY